MPRYQTLHEPGRTRWILPPRDLGPMRLLGLAFVGAGIAFASVPGVIVVKMFAAASTPMPMRVFSWLFVIPFLWGGLQLARFGILASAGRTTIALDEETLVATERAGPVRWTRRFAVSGLRRIGISGAKDEPGTPAFLKGRAALELRAPRAGRSSTRRASGGRAGTSSGRRGRSDYVAIAYPRELLRELADELAGAVAEARGDRAPLPVVDADRTPRTGMPDRSTTATPAPPPRGTKVVLERTDAGIALRVPPRGFDKGNRSFLSFAIIWSAFSTLLATFFFATARQSLPWPALLLVGVFPCIGAGMLVGAINAARRHAHAEIVGDVLLVASRNLFRLRTREWPRDEIESIVVGPTGTEINNVPVLAVLVRTTDGGVARLFAGRDEAELRWMAWALWEGLGGAA